MSPRARIGIEAVIALLCYLLTIWLAMNGDVHGSLLAFACGELRDLLLTTRKGDR